MKQIYLFVAAALMQSTYCSAQEKSRDDWLAIGVKINQIFSLSKDARIRSELEIVSSQVKELSSLKNSFDNLAIQIGEKTGSLPKKEADELRSKMWRELNTDTIKKIEKILLGHQIRRLDQIARQKPLEFVSRGDRFKKYLLMANQLDLDEAELKSFRANLLRVKNDYEKKLAELKKQTDKEAFKNLPPEARKKIRELFGDLY